MVIYEHEIIIAVRIVENNTERIVAACNVEDSESNVAECFVEDLNGVAAVDSRKGKEVELAVGALDMHRRGHVPCHRGL